MFFKVLLALMLYHAHGATPNFSRVKNPVDYLKANSIFYALSSLAQDVNISAECRDHLMQFQEQAQKKTAWAMKMLDASGQSMSGFLLGQGFWLGDRDICEAMQQPMDVLNNPHGKQRMHWGIVNETAPFDVGYSVIYLRHTSPWQVTVQVSSTEGVIQLGLCTPTACDDDDLKALIERFLSVDLFAARDFYELNLKFFSIKRMSRNLWSRSKFFQDGIFIFLASLTSLTLLCAIAAVNFDRKPKSNYLEQLANFVQCFNIARNARKIFNIAPIDDSTDVPIIYGIRVLVSIVIVSTYLNAYLTTAMSNMPYVWSSTQRSWLFFNHFIVDFFFVISGFLQAFKFLENHQKLQAIKEAKMSQMLKELLSRLFHRWLRLAPLFYVVVCLDAVQNLYMNENCVLYGASGDSEDYLARDWWRFLLFIHNFVATTELSASWSWSMGCEMQFFLAGSILLLLYAKKPVLSKIVFLAVLIGNIFAVYYNGIDGELNFNLDNLIMNGNRIYFNSLVRCTPYLLGMLGGWHLVNAKRQLSENVARFVGNLAFVVVVLLVILVHFTETADGAVSTSILLICRIALSLWVCWLIVASYAKFKAWPIPLLEQSILRPLARLSYAFYLVHPLTFVMQTNKAPIHWEPIAMVILHFGFIVAAYIGAVIFSLLFEAPYCNLSSFILKQKSSEANANGRVIHAVSVVKETSITSL